ncbi:MAG: prepilin-type N-terminal cleavage/methylation domain-containing protein [Verrucomicrobiota bacterium]|nr:prepilin-type N-terminal cleavage/methylation domain-containing protein [Verrucomicrobiota bacterium]
MGKKITSSKNGFTLVELLVVIAVIAILGSIAIPAISAAKVRANQVKCSSNMRQIGIAMISYALDNGGWLPTTTHGGGMQNSWIYQLEDYVGGGFDDIRICPSDPRGLARKNARGTSYILNEFIAVDHASPFGVILESFRHMDSLVNLGGTIFVFIVSDRVGVSGMNDHTHSRNWNTWNRVISDIQPDRHRSGAGTTNNTSGVGNYLYGDGRVEGMKANELKKIIDRGINPARPPSI